MTLTELTPLKNKTKKYAPISDTPPVPNKQLTEDPTLIPVKQEVWELSSMAVQLCLRQMVRQMMTLTDSAFQGHIGTKQLAGVALAGMWMGVPSAFIQFSIQAINTLCSQAVGADNPKLVGLWLQTAIAFAIIGSIPVITWYMCVGPMIALTLDDPETVAYGASFARIMAIGLIPQYIYGAVSTYFAAQGIIWPATICSSLTMLLNILFNRLYIYGAFGWSGMGFIGSPLATVTSTCLQLTLFLTYTVVIKKYHRNAWRGWSREALEPAHVKTFLNLALPMGASAVVDWGSATLAGAFSGFLGPEIAAGQSVLGGVFGVANSAVAGFSTSTQIRMSRYLGQGQAFAAKRVLKLGGSIVCVGAFVMMVAVGLGHTVLFQIWSKDPVILTMCQNTLAVFVFCILVAFARFLLTAVLNALALADKNLFANNLASWGVYVPLSYVLPIMLGWGLPGFWWADTAGEGLKLVMISYAVLQVDWEDAAEVAANRAAMYDSKPSEEEEKELIAYENEALVGRTPESFRAPGAITPTTPNFTPSRRHYKANLDAWKNSPAVSSNDAFRRRCKSERGQNDVLV